MMDSGKTFGAMVSGREFWAMVLWVAPFILLKSFQVGTGAPFDVLSETGLFGLWSGIFFGLVYLGIKETRKSLPRGFVRFQCIGGAAFGLMGVLQTFPEFDPNELITLSWLSGIALYLDALQDQVDAREETV